MTDRIRWAAGNISKGKKDVALYARAGTDGQATENQLLELRNVADQNGWRVTREFVDQEISEAKGRDQHPGFDAMLRAVRRGEVGMIMGWSVDRFGRSLKHLIGFLQELQSNNVDLYLHQQGVNTGTPTGRILFQMLGVFSEFERAMIRERVNAGLTRARARGQKLGRPRVSLEVEKKIMEFRSTGKGMRKISRELGVGVSTVKRVIDEARVA